MNNSQSIRPGDKVKPKSGLVVGAYYGGLTLMDSMAEFLFSREYTIVRRVVPPDVVDLEGSEFIYTTDMLEKVCEDI